MLCQIVVTAIMSWRYDTFRLRNEIPVDGKHVYIFACKHRITMEQLLHTELYLHLEFIVATVCTTYMKERNCSTTNSGVRCTGLEETCY